MVGESVARSTDPAAPQPVAGLVVDSGDPGDPARAIVTRTAPLDVLRRHLHPDVDGVGRGAATATCGIDRLRRSALRPSRTSAVVRRSPGPSGVEGEFVDPDVPGFIFVGTDTVNVFVIKDSTIRVIWEPAAGQWTDEHGTVLSFQSAPTAGPEPLLELPGKLPLPKQRSLPALGTKQWDHFEITMDVFKRMSLWDQMLKIAELADSYPVTPIELFWQTKPREKDTRFYRYHKFPLDPTAQQLVFGGGINKTEITEEWLQKNLKALIKTRYDLLRQLGSQTTGTQVKAMQKFQANAMSTPFIATTTDREYAEGLFHEYPPTESQKACILVIEGPMSHAFDFEAEFEAIGGQVGGRSEWKWRTSADRAKDAGQSEFGLPDLFIPLRGVSPLGFRIVEVIECGVPEDPDLLDLFTHDQRLQIVRASTRPRLTTKHEQKGGE